MSSILFSLLCWYNIIYTTHCNSEFLAIFWQAQTYISVRRLPCQIEGSSPPSLVPAKLKTAKVCRFAWNRSHGELSDFKESSRTHVVRNLQKSTAWHAGSYISYGWLDSRRSQSANWSRFTNTSENFLNIFKDKANTMPCCHASPSFCTVSPLASAGQPASVEGFYCKVEKKRLSKTKVDKNCKYLRMPPSPHQVVTPALRPT